MGNINIPAEESRRGTRINEVMLERDERDMLGGDDGRKKGGRDSKLCMQGKGARNRLRLSAAGREGMREGGQGKMREVWRHVGHCLRLERGGERRRWGGGERLLDRGTTYKLEGRVRRNIRRCVCVRRGRARGVGHGGGERGSGHKKGATVRRWEAALFWRLQALGTRQLEPSPVLKGLPAHACLCGEAPEFVVGLVGVVLGAVAHHPAHPT